MRKREENAARTHDLDVQECLLPRRTNTGPLSPTVGTHAEHGGTAEQEQVGSEVRKVAPPLPDEQAGVVQS